MEKKIAFGGVVYTLGRGGKHWAWAFDGCRKRRMSLEEAQALMAEAEKPKRKRKKGADTKGGDDA